MKKYLHFEGIRGLAAFIVYLAHFKPTFCIDIDKRIVSYLEISGVKNIALFENLISTLFEGVLPVFIFWFMSAFLISIKLFDPVKNEHNKYLVEVSTKRYFRLAIPVFFSSLLCFILIKTHSMYNVELANHLGAGYNGDTYKDGWLKMWYEFDPGIVHFLRTTIVEVFMTGNSNYNMALWTMNPELLGSFLCFGLFVVMGRNKHRFTIYLLVSSFLLVAGFREVTYFYYFTFVCGLMWCDVINSVDDGVFLKERIRKIYDSPILAAALLVAGFAGTIYSDVYHPIHENLYYFCAFPVKAIGFTLLVNNTGMLRKIFSIKPLTFFGKISFSFYLLHIPVMFSAGIYLYLYAGIVSPHKVLIVFGLLTLINIILSFLFEKYVDRKAISLSNKIGKYFSSRQS